MRVLITDITDDTLICTEVNETRYEPNSQTMWLQCAESVYFADDIPIKVYESMIYKLNIYGYADLSATAFKEEL